MKARKRKEVVVYHVFGHGVPDVFTRDYSKAMEAYRGLVALGLSRRLYREIYATEVDYENNRVLTETCLRASGPYPT